MMTFKEFAELKNKTTQSWYKPDFNQEKNELVRQSNALKYIKKRYIRSIPKWQTTIIISNNLE